MDKRIGKFIFPPFFYDFFGILGGNDTYHRHVFILFLDDTHKVNGKSKKAFGNHYQFLFSMDPVRIKGNAVDNRQQSEGLRRHTFVGIP